jgi:hypothetical protein
MQSLGCDGFRRPAGVDSCRAQNGQDLNARTGEKMKIATILCACYGNPHQGLGRLRGNV